VPRGYQRRPWIRMADNDENVGKKTTEYLAQRV
jgi:hypothetical protein